MPKAEHSSSSSSSSPWSDGPADSNFAVPRDQQIEFDFPAKAYYIGALPVGVSCINLRFGVIGAGDLEASRMYR